MNKGLRHIAGMISCCLLLLVGCSEDGRPSGLISEEEIVPVLKDMQVAYAGVDQSVKNPLDRAGKYEEMNQHILRKHNMDKDQFMESYEWYRSQPQLMDSLYQRVITELSIELVPLQNKKKPAPLPKKEVPAVK